MSTSQMWEEHSLSKKASDTSDTIIVHKKDGLAIYHKITSQYHRIVLSPVPFLEGEHRDSPFESWYFR
jgi:hypothetical protein